MTRCEKKGDSMFEYGELMLRQGDINSLAEWSEDKEEVCSIMDREFDYLWDFSKGIHFIDRLYSYGLRDEKVEEREKKGEVELWFGSFDDVRGWIKEEKRRKIELIDKQVAIDAINLADDKGEIHSILDVIEILRRLPPVERREV